VAQNGLLRAEVLSRSCSLARVFDCGSYSATSRELELIPKRAQYRPSLSCTRRNIVSLRCRFGGWGTVFGVGHAAVINQRQLTETKTTTAINEHGQLRRQHYYFSAHSMSCIVLHLYCFVLYRLYSPALSDCLIVFPRIFTVRRSALHGLWDRNSVRLSVRLSHSWTVSTWLELRS